MGKVTVKHYLEKKVKPTTIYGSIVAYPVYLRITVNRKTTQIRSLTEMLMSEVAFDNYKRTNKVDYDESMIDTSVNQSMKLENEPELIKLCIETIIRQQRDYDFSDRNVRQLVGILLLSASEALIKVAWQIEISGIPEIDSFVGSFNRQLSLVHSVKNFQKALGIDIVKFIPSDCFKRWQVVELTEYSGGRNLTFVEFIYTDYTNTLIALSQNTSCRDYCLISGVHNVTDEDIKSISHDLVKLYLYKLQ